MKIKEMPSQLVLKELFDYDTNTGIFRWKVRLNSRICIGDIAGGKSNHGYIRIAINKKLYSAHRLSWKYYYGVEPEHHIDHINGDRLDNRIINLREATSLENNRNTKKKSNNTSGFKGVSYHKRVSKWIARSSVNGVRVELGYFDTPEEASEVYIKFTKERFKEFYKEIV